MTDLWGQYSAEVHASNHCNGACDSGSHGRRLPSLLKIRARVHAGGAGRRIATNTAAAVVNVALSHC